METGGVIPGQEGGSRSQQEPINPDGHVMVDVESLSSLLYKEFSSSSPRITRNVSRIGPSRSNNETNETSFPHSPLRGSSSNTSDSSDHAAAATTTASDGSGSPIHQITITTAVGNVISEQNKERRLGYTRKSSFKRSHTSWILDPKKVVLFFATLSSMGSILLIIFTLSITKSNPGDMTLD